MTKIKCVCEQCEKEFYKYPYQETKRFCSNDCYHKSTRFVRVITFCICGKEMHRTPHEIEAGVRKYCSQKCYHESRLGKPISDYQKACLAKSQTWRSKNNVKCKCLNCGKEFWQWPSNIKHGRNKYCSNACKFSSEAFKRNAASKATGKKKTDSTIKKMSARMKSENNPMYGKPCPHITGTWYELENGNKIWLRSSYEVRTANSLNGLGIAWSYEPSRFDLNGFGTYAPDFLIEGKIWWEVKGFMRATDKAKLLKFIEFYPEENLRIIGQRDIEKMEYFINNNISLDVSTLGTDLDGFKSKAHYIP